MHCITVNSMNGLYACTPCIDRLAAGGAAFLFCLFVHACVRHIVNMISLENIRRIFVKLAAMMHFVRENLELGPKGPQNRILSKQHFDIFLSCTWR